MLNVARGAEMFALREKGQSCICQEIGEAVTLLESGMAIASEFEHRELCITPASRSRMYISVSIEPAKEDTGDHETTRKAIGELKTVVALLEAKKAGIQNYKNDIRDNEPVKIELRYVVRMEGTQ